MLSLSEKILLASIDENKRRITAGAYNFYRFGLKGAALLKLVEANKIIIENRKICLKDSSLTGDEVIDMTLGYIAEKKRPISTNSWFYGHTAINRNLKDKVIEKLEDRGILIQEKKRFLGIFPYNRYNVESLEEKNKVKELVNSIVLDDCRNTTYENVIFVSLLAICSCERLFMSKTELKSIKPKLKQIKKGEYFLPEDNNIKEVLRAISYAIAAQVASASSAGV